MRAARVGAVLGLVVAAPASAVGPCFDFSAKVTAPLREAARAKGEGDATEQGTREDHTVWAALRGEVRQPLGKVLERLLNHETTRDPSVDELRVEKLEAAQYLALHRVRSLVKPFLFVEVRWTEEWGYALAKGTAAEPEEVVISYQKTEGTSHMEHFCGSIVLRRAGAEATDVSQYEEARITGRSAQATVDGLAMVLKRLRAR